MRTTPPITPPMIGLLSMFEELGDELDELPDGTLVEVGVFEEVGVIFEGVEDGC